jgi:hypothetical protein
VTRQWLGSRIFAPVTAKTRGDFFLLRRTVVPSHHFEHPIHHLTRLLFHLLRRAAVSQQPVTPMLSSYLRKAMQRADLDLSKRCQPLPEHLTLQRQQRLRSTVHRLAHQSHSVARTRWNFGRQNHQTWCGKPRDWDCCADPSREA